MKLNSNSITPIILVLLIVMILVIALAYISLQEEEYEEASVPIPPHLYSSSQHIIGTGNKLGTYFPGGKLLSRWFNDNLDKKGGSFKAVETNGSIDNIKLLKVNSIQFGMSEARIVKEAYSENSNIRVVWPLWVDVVQILKPPSDLVPDYVFPGKNIGFIGQQDSSTSRTTKEIFSALSLKEKRSKNIPYDRVIDLIGEGKLGFAMIQAGIPNHSVSDALIFYNCGLVSFNPEQLDLIRGKVFSSVNFTIPSGYYYEKQPEINTIALPNVLVSNVETSPEMVEFVTEMIVKGRPLLKGSFKAFETIPQDNEAILKILSETGVPLHEGTRRWLQKVSNESNNTDRGEEK